MIRLKGKYSYRFASPKNVYVISSSKPGAAENMHFYSVPHTPHGAGSLESNALLAYMDRDRCIQATQKLACEPVVGMCMCMSLEDLKYLSVLMRMPAVVIVKETVEEDASHYEIHFVKHTWATDQ